LNVAIIEFIGPLLLSSGSAALLMIVTLTPFMHSFIAFNVLERAVVLQETTLT